MKIGVLGFGREGREILKFLKPRTANDRQIHEVFVLDKKRKLELPQYVRARLGENYLNNLSQFDIIFRSPGIPYNLKEIGAAKRSGTVISSATELFFSAISGSAFRLISLPKSFGGKRARKIGCKIIGITGTKGKSTTATLIYKILKAAGKDAYLAGNIGKPALSILPKLKKRSFVVLEFSSFQLQELRHSPEIAVVLGLFPDHMDAHKNFREYIGAKANMAKWQKKSDVVFYAAGNKYAKAIAAKSPGKKIPVQYKDIASPYKLAMSQELRGALRIPGEHQFKNALMAVYVARYLGIPEKIILKAARNFRGLPNRLQLIRNIRISNSHISHYVNFYNDSAATNPHTAAAAIKSFKEPLILIAGGKDKNLDYAPLAQALKKSLVKYVVLYGENKDKIAKAILLGYGVSGMRHRVTKCKNLKEAVKIAYRYARSLYPIHYTLNPVVLFSPASASFDQFKDYKERGETFKNIVKKLKI